MKTNPDSELHVVLGAGQIGPRLARRLLRRGHRVRLVRRTEAAPPDPRIELRAGDMADSDFAVEVCAGAAVVYDCMNPPYHRWPERLLPLAQGGLRGAAAAGARLVALDCLYGYGRPTEPMSETTPFAPCSVKGRLRVDLHDLRTSAHARGDARVAIGRASDFIGPGLPLSVWNPRFLSRLLAGKPGEVFGDPDRPHAYTYADDVAAGLETLGAEPRALGEVWHLPTAPAESTRRIAARLGRALGVAGHVRPLPRWLLRGLGVLSPMMRELAEMTYQWEVDFEVDDRKFVDVFGYGATPIEGQVEAMATWARSLSEGQESPAGDAQGVRR